MKHETQFWKTLSLKYSLDRINRMQEYFQILAMLFLQQLQCDFCRFRIIWEQVNNEM